MDSLELNKAAAAVLLAGIAFVGSGLIGKALVNPHEPDKLAITIAVPEAPAAAGTAAPEPPIGVLMASADAAKGEAQVKAQGCVACHTFTKGGKNGVGPNLYGIVGSPVADVPGYDFSNALKAKKGPWTFQELNEWLTKPSAYAPGTKMSYAGLADPKKRADIIEYLRTLSDKPEPKPPVEEGAAASAAPANPATAGATPNGVQPAAAAGGAAAGESIAQRMAAADPKAGQAATMKLGCNACHTFNEGGKAGIGPNLYGVLGAPIGAHMQGYNYSQGLKAHTGPWTYEEMDKWLTKPAAFAPGTKMTFVGVADPKQRADIIAYLRSLSPNPEPLPQ